MAAKEPNSALKIQSLSDLNERGHGLLTFIRADDVKCLITVTESDLEFWRARIDSVLLKAKDR